MRASGPGAVESEHEPAGVDAEAADNTHGIEHGDDGQVRAERAVGPEEHEQAHAGTDEQAADHGAGAQGPPRGRAR